MNISPGTVIVQNNDYFKFNKPSLINSFMLVDYIYLDNFERAKFLNNSRKVPALMELLEGQVPMTNFNPDKVKKRLFEEGYLQEECSMCGFNERRLLDYKIPLLLHFKDNNKKNWRLENLEVLCYNHYFLTIGDIFSVKDEEQIETSRPLSKTTDAIDFELDDYQIQRLRELGLYDPPKGDDDLDLISRI